MIKQVNSNRMFKHPQRPFSGERLTYNEIRKVILNEKVSNSGFLEDTLHWIQNNAKVLDSMIEYYRR